MVRFFVFFLIFYKTALFSQDKLIEKSGDIIQIGLPVIAFGSTLLFKGSDKPHWQFAKAMGLSFISTHALKRIINKERPNGGDHAFPSGHTSAAFTGAAFIQKRYGWKLGIPSYLLASYVGFSRIHANKHDIYDVLAGATLGVMCSYFFTRPYQENILKITLNKNENNDFLVGFNYYF